jgi:hypothetical protein
MHLPLESMYTAIVVPLAIGKLQAYKFFIAFAIENGVLIECPGIVEFDPVRPSIFLVSLSAEFQENSTLEFPNPLTLSMDLGFGCPLPWLLLMLLLLLLF